MDSVLTFWIAAVWGVAVLGSWVGWGTLAGMLLAKEKRIDWGLRAAWGMGVTLAIGGLLVCLQIATATVLQVMVMAGLAMWLLIVYGGPRAKAARAEHRVGRGVWGWKLPVIVLVVVAYLGSVGATSSVDLNWSDDMPIYLPLVKRMVQTGNLNEPFSLRRLSSYGGQWLLQGEVMAVGTESNGMLVDKGLSVVVLAGLMWGMMAEGRGKPGRGRAAVVLAVMLAGLLVDVPRVNTQSQMTGVVLFLGLLRTLMLGGGGADRRIRIRRLSSAVMAGVVAAGLGSLRMNYAPVAGLVLVVAYGVRAWRNRGVWQLRLGEGAVAVGSMVVLVVPWAGALWESSRSLFYPAMLGNQRGEFSAMYASAMTFGEKVAFVTGYLTYWKAVVLIVPVVLIWRRRFRGTGLAIYAGAICGSLAVAWVFTAISNATLYRYTFPMLFAAALYAIGLTLRSGRWSWRSTVASAWVVMMLALNVPAAWGNHARSVEEMVTWNTKPRVFAPPRLVDQYVSAQQAIPAGEGVYAAVSLPSLLDFSRNRVFLADELGIVAPDPGIPVLSGPAAVRAYFLSKGIHYILAVNFDEAAGLYSRPVYVAFRGHPEHLFMGDVIEHNLAPVVLKMEENIDALAMPERTQVFGPVRVIKLD